MKTCAYCGRENDDNARACTGCGTTLVETTVLPPQSYGPRPSSPGKRIAWLSLFWTPAVAGAIIWLLASIFPHSPILVMLLPLGFLTCWVGSIVAHELGHYLAVRAVGLKPLSVNIGIGPLLWHRQLPGSLSLNLRAFPFCGYVSFWTHGQPRLRPKIIIIAAAGPIVSILLACVAWKLWLADRDAWAALGLVYRFGQFMPALLLINAGFALGTLVPFYENIVGAKTPTDGLLLLKTIFRWNPTLWNVNWIRLSEELAQEETRTASTGKTNDSISQWARTVNAQDPNWVLPHYREMLEQGDMPANVRIPLLDLFATAVLMFGADQYLADADRYSEELLRSNPSEWTFMGTRGSVLVELGKLDEGMPILLSVFENDPKPFDKAIAAAYLALGELGKGELERASAWVVKSREADPNCVPLRRIAEMICKAVG